MNFAYGNQFLMRNNKENLRYFGKGWINKKLKKYKNN